MLIVRFSETLWFGAISFVYFFASVASDFGNTSRNLPNQCPEDFLCFLLLVQGPKCVYFELAFVNRVRRYFNFISLHAFPIYGRDSPFLICSEMCKFISVYDTYIWGYWD